MSQKTTLIKGETKKSLQEISAFLEDLAKKIRAGKVTLTQGTNELEFELPEICELEVQVDEKPKGNTKKFSLEIEIDWAEGSVESEEIKLA